MNKQQEITAQTRKNLMDAFWSIYQEKRIEKITVREITARAGYNRGTFYEYFADVYHLLDEIENAVIPSIDELPLFATNTGTIGLPLKNFMRLYEDNSKYYAVLLGEKGDPAFAAKLKSRIKQSLLALFTNDHTDSAELDYALEYILSAMIGIMCYWFSQNQRIPKEQLIALIHRLNEHGISGVAKAL